MQRVLSGCNAAHPSAGKKWWVMTNHIFIAFSRLKTNFFLLSCSCQLGVPKTEENPQPPLQICQKHTHKEQVPSDVTLTLMCWHHAATIEPWMDAYYQKEKEERSMRACPYLDRVRTARFRSGFSHLKRLGNQKQHGLVSGNSRVLLKRQQTFHQLWGPWQRVGFSVIKHGSTVWRHVNDSIASTETTLKRKERERKWNHFFPGYLPKQLEIHIENIR